MRYLQNCPAIRSIMRTCFRKRAHTWLGFSSMVTCALCLTSIAKAQNALPPASLMQRSISQIAAYGGAMRIIATVDAKARALDSQGIASSGLRTAVAQKIGLGTLEFALFVQICRDADTKMQTLDSQAKQIISNTKAQFINQGAPGSAKLPPPPAQLLALQKQKDDIVRQAMVSLDGQLSADGRKHIDEYVHSLLGVNQVIQIP
jgi:hypothetical protein